MMSLAEMGYGFKNGDFIGAGEKVVVKDAESAGLLNQMYADPLAPDFKPGMILTVATAEEQKFQVDPTSQLEIYLTEVGEEKPLILIPADRDFFAKVT